MYDLPVFMFVTVLLPELPLNEAEAGWLTLTLFVFVFGFIVAILVAYTHSYLSRSDSSAKDNCSLLYFAFVY